MTAQQRRTEILKMLSQGHGPLSASALAAQLGVSRQIVVGDIALLRAAGHEISATPRGYLCQSYAAGYTAMLACQHDAEGLRDELFTVVDNGGTVEDVKVENLLYGEISGRLHIASRYDADAFVRLAAEQPDCLLSRMTGGVHLHTLVCPDKETFDRIEAELDRKGFLYRK